MKYEMIFGDYEFASSTCEIAVRSGYGDILEMSLIAPIVIPDEWGVIAMRRIIAEPKRWTWEDKKAGRLPEVGAKCRQGHKDEIVIAVTEKFVVTECQDMSVCTTRKDVFMRSYNPIETPAEKAQRLKSEWCAKAAKQLKNLEYTSTLTSIYDALLSGELQAPKGGE